MLFYKWKEVEPVAMPKFKRSVFKWGPLSPKQKFIFTWWRNKKWQEKDAIIAEGSIRAGKTVSMALSYVDWATENFTDMNFIMAGKTIQSFRRNVIEPLKQMMDGRKYQYKEHLTQNYMTVFNPRTGNVCYFWIFGGKDEASQSLVQGITAAGAFFDEVALMPESFVNQATGRCSIEGSKFWFNCNPSGPMHWFKKKWIDACGKKNAIVIHFNMDDNLTLSEKMKARYRSMYSGVFFKRYILGLWVVAEGVIYDMFDTAMHLSKLPGFTRWQADRLFISVDYGIQNPMTFGMYGVKRLSPYESRYHLFKTYYHSGRDEGVQKTDAKYVEDLLEFIGEDEKKLSYIIVDPSATSFIAALRELKTDKGKQRFKIIPAKNSVIDGIALTMNLLESRMFTVDPSCKHDIDEFHAYAWDEEAALKRGDEKPLKINDHCMDRTRYALLTDSILFRGYKPRSGKGGME